MPGLVLSVMVNPFKRLPRYEYVYGPASYEALDPIAPLLDDTVYDNTGIVIVGDQYSVWPETNIFPKVTSYKEVLEKLEKFMKRRCSTRLSPRLCKRLEYATAPWIQLVGGWSFTGAPSDAEAFIAYHVLNVLRNNTKRVDEVIVVLDPDADTGLSHILSLAARYLAAITGSTLSILVSGARPYPPSPKTTIMLQEIERKKPQSLLKELASAITHTSLSELGGELLEPRTPLGAKRYRYRSNDAENLTITTVLALAKRYYALLPYQACGAKDPIDKLYTILNKAIELYVDATQLTKKRIGGAIVHHLGFRSSRLRALLAGAAIEAWTLRTVLRHQQCETIYNKGVSKDVIIELQRLFGETDETPRKHVEESNSYIRLRRLNELRQTLIA